MTTTAAFNPGSEPLSLGNEYHALTNILRLAADIAAATGTPIRVPGRHTHTTDGRYAYTLTVQGREHHIEMPGVPLNQVRYTRANDQNPFDFPRLWVDGGSWLWPYAVDRCTREPSIDN